MVWAVLVAESPLLLVVADPADFGLVLEAPGESLGPEDAAARAVVEMRLRDAVWGRWRLPVGEFRWLEVPGVEFGLVRPFSGLVGPPGAVAPGFRSVDFVGLVAFGAEAPERSVDGRMRRPALYLGSRASGEAGGVWRRRGAVPDSVDLDTGLCSVGGSAGSGSGGGAGVPDVPAGWSRAVHPTVGGETVRPGGPAGERLSIFVSSELLEAVDAERESLLAIPEFDPRFKWDPSGKPEGIAGWEGRRSRAAMARVLIAEALEWRAMLRSEGGSGL